MNKRSVLRTVILAAVLAMLLSMSAFADRYGAQLKVDPTPQYVTVTNAPDNTMLHKFVMPKDGMMTFTGVEMGTYSNYGLSFSLLKAGNVPINRYGSSSTYVNGTDKNSSSFVRQYALKKGTYIIRVTNTKNYRIGAFFTGVNDQGKGSKKKGTVLKRNKTMTALFGANETSSKSEWFKIKLTKKRKIRLSAASYGDASYRIYVYGPKPYKKGDGGTYLSSDSQWTYEYGIRKGFSGSMKKLNKGTYYIKVERTSNDVSGYVKIGWK